MWTTHIVASAHHKAALGVSIAAGEFFEVEGGCEITGVRIVKKSEAIRGSLFYSNEVVSQQMSQNLTK